MSAGRSATTTANPPKPTRLPLVLVLIVPLLVFWPVTWAEFIPLDDPTNVTRNPGLNPPTLAGIGQFWTGPYFNMYAPLTYTAWAGVARVAWMETPEVDGVQLNPYVFHAANLLVHLVNALLAYAILRKLSAPRWAACGGTLLFAVHPMQVEPVAWVTGFRDLLAAMFALASLLAYLTHATRDARDDARDARAVTMRSYVLACAFLIAALLSKPTTVVVPLIAAALDWGFVGRSWRRMAMPIGGMVLLAMPFALLTMRFQSASLTYTPPLWGRPIIALDAIGFYLLKLIAPLRVGLDYGRSPQWLLEQRRVMWLVGVGILCGMVLWMLRRDRRILAGSAVFVAALLPVLGMTKFDFQHHSTVADRYVYLAMLGPAVLLACATRRGGGGRATGIACGIVLAALAVRSHAQARAWETGESIYRATLAANPDSLIANRGLGLIAQSSSRIDDAEAHFQSALRAHPDDPTTNFYLGNLYLGTGRPKEAVPHLRLAAAARNQAWVVTNYATALARSGEVAEAKQVLLDALAKSPETGRAELHATLAAVLFRLDDRAGAAAQYRAALRVNPDFAPAAQELAALERAATTPAPATQPPP